MKVLTKKSMNKIIIIIKLMKVPMIVMIIISNKLLGRMMTTLKLMR